MVTVAHNGAVSVPVAATTISNGNWVLDVSLLLTRGGVYFQPQAGDAMHVVGAGSAGNWTTENVAYTASPSYLQIVPDMCLPQSSPV
jgi:hypothetical protein